MKMDWTENVLIVIGLVMFGHGLWLIWPPAMFLVMGALFLAAGTNSYMKRKAEAPNG